MYERPPWVFVAAFAAAGFRCAPFSKACSVSFANAFFADCQTSLNPLEPSGIVHEVDAVPFALMACSK